MVEERVDIAIFAKAPIPGLTKTRLIPTIGATDAARLHRRMSLHAIRVAQGARVGDVTLWCAPDASHPFFRDAHRCFNVELRVQPSGALGARMATAFAQAGPARPLLLIGTDCPALTEQHLIRSADALRQGAAATFLPAEDGGYVLVGLRAHLPEIFERIDWGEPVVMQQTRQRLRDLGIAWSEGESLWDVDRPADLERLCGLHDGH